MDADKLKDFALYNFEKLIVLLVVAMSGFLVWAGYNKPDVTKEHDPDRLTQNANDVRSEVDVDHSDQIIPDREPEMDIAVELAKYRKKIPADLYIPQVWEAGKIAANKVRRKDPDLGKPEGIQVHGVIASMAFRSKDGLYPLADLEPADPVEVVDKKPKRERRSRKRDMMNEMMGGDQGGMDMEMEMQMMMDMQAEMGSVGEGPSGPVRKLAPDKNLGATAETTTSLTGGAEQPPVPGIGLFITGSAVIPHKAIIDSYQESLSYASDYSPRERDRPRYIAYEVQRAEVTNKPVDQLVDADWIVRDSNRITILNAANFWSGFAPEIVPADYWVPGVTMWIPPLLLDPYNKIATHPLIPLKTQNELEQEQLNEEALKASEESGPIDLENFKVDIAGGVSHSMGGMDMYMDESMGMGGGMEEDMMGYGGMGGRVSGMEGKPAEDNPVDYKLLRFYDFAYLRGAPRDPNIPRLGRKYVYRIRFAVEDPNFPEKPEMQPQGNTLDPDAYQRFLALSAEAVQNQVRSYKRWSEWSEVSPPVSLPSKFDKSFVGPVKPNRSRFVRVGSRLILAEPESPTAEVVATSFDMDLGTFVPTLIEATGGTVFSKKAESTDVVDPITLEVRKTGEKVIDSATTVIDIDGGTQMEVVADDDTMTEPGIMLTVDSNGKLHVRDSVEEQFPYRIKSFAEERGL